VRAQWPALRFDQTVDLVAQLAIADPDESPGLHESHARGEMRRVQETLHQGIVQGIRQKVAHVPPQGDDAIYGRDLLLGEILHSVPLAKRKRDGDFT